jgi:hypothetical protein
MLTLQATTHPIHPLLLLHRTTFFQQLAFYAIPVPEPIPEPLYQDYRTGFGCSVSGMAVKYSNPHSHQKYIPKAFTLHAPNICMIGGSSGEGWHNHLERNMQVIGEHGLCILGGGRCVETGLVIWHEL